MRALASGLQPLVSKSCNYQDNEWLTFPVGILGGVQMTVWQVAQRDPI